MNKPYKSRPSVQRFYFEESNNLQNEIIALHDFVLPMSTAMWQFGNTIKQELRSASPPNAAQRAEKYNTAPNTRGTTDLIHPFNTISWDDQLQRIAEISLVNVIAIFEVWCDEISTKLGRADLAIRLQFPTNASKTKGVGLAIAEITGSESAPLKESIYVALIKSKKYSFSTLDNLLKSFRYFKGKRCSDRTFRISA